MQAVPSLPNLILRRPNKAHTVAAPIKQQSQKVHVNLAQISRTPLRSRDNSKASSGSGGSSGSSRPASRSRLAGVKSETTLAPIPSIRSSQRSYTVPANNAGNGRASSKENHESLPAAQNGHRQKTIDPETLRIARVQNLARKHRLNAYEVKGILEHFDKAFQKSGQLDRESFQAALSAIFDHKDLNDKVVQGAWEACTTSGIHGVDVDIEAFLSWYVVNMFTSVAQLTACADKVASEELVYKLARKHAVSAYVMDKVKRRFDLYDSDNSGEIDYEEFQEMMRKILRTKASDDLSEDRMLRFWQEIDRDGSGEVDFAEFAQWYLKYFNPENEASMGPIEAFYASFNPDAQRHNELSNRVNEN